QLRRVQGRQALPRRIPLRVGHQRPLAFSRGVGGDDQDGPGRGRAMTTTQDAVFVAAEADRWFTRNREALNGLDLDRDPPLRLVSLYRLAAKNVLEIGASNGFRLAELARRTGARAVAVEPSPLAI